MAHLTRPRAPRLHGRQEPLEVLQAALNRSGRSGLQLLLVAGEAGVGKTALVQRLRPAVRQAQGCFVLGKCDQFRADAVLQAPRRALQQLLRQLATQSKRSLGPLRRALLHELGSDAAALVPLLPELQTLLGELPPARPLEPQETPVRLRSLMLQLLQRLVHHLRPLVLVLDDLHWADQPTLDLLATLGECSEFGCSEFNGLVLIGLYRPQEALAGSPLQQLLDRLAVQAQPPLQLELHNLPRADLTALVADMLASEPAAVADLAALVHRFSGGNPFFAGELLRALHRDGQLQSVACASGWAWDGAAIARRLTPVSVEDFLLGQLAGLPSESLDTLVTLACLGSRTTLTVLADITRTPPSELLSLLAPALQQGVLNSQAPAALRAADPQADLGFSHDRLQQAASQMRDAGWRSAMQLRIARRLAHGPQRLHAAAHYVQAAALLEHPSERQQVMALLLEAAQDALAAGGFDTADCYLRTAFTLLDEQAWTRVPQLAWDLHAAQHQVSYCRADYAHADGLYATLEQQAKTPQALLGPCCIQVMSLSNRSRYGEAVQLAAALLARLGIALPEGDLSSAVARELEDFEQAVRAGALEQLPAIHPEPADGSVVKLMNRLVPAAFFGHPPLACWLVLYIARQWIAGDRHPAGLYPMACTLLATVPWRDDYRSGTTAARMALATGEACDAGVETARTRHVYALLNSHWCEPLEKGLLQARRAHEELRRGGELEFACYTFFTTQAALFDTAATLADLAEDNRRALAFARRTGNRHAEPAYEAFTRLIADLRGGDGGDRSLEPALELELLNPMAACYGHLCRGLVACLLQDTPALKRHAEAALRLETYITGFYPVVWIRLLEAFALLWRCRHSEENGTAVERLEKLQGWLVARAADSPHNFEHLVDLLAAERLVSEGHATLALPVYERAMRAAIAHRRPWHAALATERAARCYLALDLEQAGQRLLEQAHQRYGAWGATHKQRLLAQEFPFLRAMAPLLPEGETLLQASQRLASLRTTAELAQASAEWIADLSGATDVQIFTLHASQRWERQGSVSAGLPLSRQSLEEAAAAGLVPGSAVRLALRRLVPVISDDAVLDTRFHSDAHLRDLDLCSLVVVPLIVQNRAIGVAIAEHRGMRGVFAADLARAVQLVCGQLAVALENALIQRSLEQQVARRSAELRAAYEREARNEEQRRRLLEQKLKTSLTAAAVVHEIQQPLSAILLNCRLASRSLKNQPLEKLPAALIASLAQLSRDGDQVVATMERIRMLLRNVETEHGPLNLCASVDSALLFLKQDLARQAVEPKVEGLDQPCPIRGDGAQLQIAVVNLIRNSLQAMEAQPPAERRLLVKLCRQAEQLELVVADSGPGFPQDFSGDTSWELLQSTKATGMGIGLFLAETAATNHRGQLSLGRSASLGGAEVRLILPLH